MVSGDRKPDEIFPYSSRTRWQSLAQQTFELEVDLEEQYVFRLELEGWGRPEKIRIKKEVVLCNERPVFEFVDGEVHLFNNEYQRRVTYPFDWFRSALATIQARPENRRLMKFKNWIETLYCLELNPREMSKLAEHEDAEPAFDLSNFASWYRHMAQEQAGCAAKLQEDLRRIIPGLASLDLSRAGATSRILAGNFDLPSPTSPPQGYPVAFDELSDGQRVLICLYALLNFVVEGDACLFLDEPENYIALPEVQPWLIELRDRIEDRGGQVVLLSHHPEMINYLAPEFGVVFERVGPGPVRVHKYRPDQSLLPSEQIARGWSTDG